MFAKRVLCLIVPLVLMTSAAMAAGTANVDREVGTNYMYIAPDGQFDLENNHLIYYEDSSQTGVNPITRLVGYLTTGYYHSGANDWKGYGIASSFAKTDPGGVKALGVISNNNGGSKRYTTYFTVSTLLTDSLVRYTYPGDTDLNGSVNFADFSALITAYGGSGKWYQGDFNYDGKINFTDFSTLITFYGSASLGNPQGSALNGADITPIPEPSMSILWASGLIGFYVYLKRKLK